MSNLTGAGILSPESALKELQEYGAISKEAKVGIDPNKIPTQPKGAANGT
jgi:hypothetical protein